MAQTAGAVTKMSEELRAKALPAAAAELEVLRAFAAAAQGVRLLGHFPSHLLRTN